MKSILVTLILFIYSTGGWAQSIKGYSETYQRKDKIFNQMIIDTIHKTVFYGMAGIQKTQPIDSSKYFYRRFLKLKKEGVSDSCNPYKLKLDHYKK